jgi:phenylalanyl-tRNA synthetase alpha chain
MIKELDKFRTQIDQEIEATRTFSELENVRVKWIGRHGKLTLVLRKIGDLPPDERPCVGKAANQIKRELEAKIKSKKRILQEKETEKKIEETTFDITLPPPLPLIGKTHPITKVLGEIVDVFFKMGFQIADGPEIELEYYNFDALNILPDHPARDMHDTFYIKEGLLLRTHTSPVQIRVMESKRPPLRIIVPGKVYRRDADISHSPMFHQIEGLLVGTQTSFADLKGVLTTFVHHVFGGGTKIRFRPSFFPFTEPSAEVDIECIICQGKGCGVCKWGGWLEVLGAGMVDPEVFQQVNYDPEQYVGFAFGLGVERIAMLKYGVDNIRLFFENDLRFLDQF